MHVDPRCATRLASLAFLAAAATACGSRLPVDPKNREIPWTYGPTTGGATAEHVRGTGTKGGGPIAQGWKCRLVDGKRLTVEPYQLAESHPLFGKVVLGIGLFDHTGTQTATLRSEPVTAQRASFTFELTEAVASRLVEVAIWYSEP